MALKPTYPTSRNLRKILLVKLIYQYISHRVIIIKVRNMNVEIIWVK